MIRLAAALTTVVALLLTSASPARAASAVLRLPELVATQPPAVEGTARQGRTLKAFPGRWTPEREETRYRWLRDSAPIRGATQRRHVLTALDVGTRISVQVRVRAAGHAWTTVESPRTRRVDYAALVRRRVTYAVATRGRIMTSVREFARLAQETFGDARGCAPVACSSAGCRVAGTSPSCCPRRVSSRRSPRPARRRGRAGSGAT